MFRQVTVMSLSVFALCLGTFGLGQDPGDKKPAKKQGLTEIKFERVVPSKTLLDREVRGIKDKPIGKVKDVVLDLELGHVAFVMVELAGLNEKNKGVLAIPPMLLQSKGNSSTGPLALRRGVNNARSAKARTLPTAAYHKSLNRGFVTEQYKIFKQRPYWVVQIKGAKPSSKKPRQETPPAEQVDMTYMLTLLSEVEDRKVADQRGKVVGGVADLALAKGHRKIAYAAVKLQGEPGKRFPIPLGALVVEDREGPWLIELPAKSIADQASFSQDDKQWPASIERGWVEYIQVRYGRNLPGGVQNARKSNNKD